ncbi:MAG: holo-ACP synthase [Firmicutes bacterium]|nr:holo-ACP synthase [Bacillota bacterium]
MQKIFSPPPFMKNGVDITDVERIKNLHLKWGQSFLERVFDDEEIRYCMGKSSCYPHLAGRFASKEAIIKILKTHISPPLKTISIHKAPNGEPMVCLKDEAAKMAEEAGITHISISISHSGDYAVAFATAYFSKPE